jgi:TolB-like protein
MHNAAKGAYQPVVKGGSVAAETLVDRIIKLLADLKRHNIYRVAAAYMVVAWVLGQLVGILMPVFELPPWIARAFLLLLALGFPVALVFAWVHQLAPDSGALPRVTTGKLDWVLAGGLAVVIALVSYQQFTQTAGERAVPVQQAGVEAARAAASVAAGVSIAVLPFTNLSSDAEQEFFSDGMTEEITSALAKVPGLIVIGRTSAFGFKGQNKDLRLIGQALGTTHLIEGSVRKVGTRVRITAQLIVADSGAHLWSENYDRELTDIFAVQEDIAEAIAGALRVPLGLPQGETLVRDRTNNPESYDQYLRARALWRARSPGFNEEMIKILEPVVARNPGYAPAWALLAVAYGGRSPDKQEKALREAIRLDPRNVIANGILANIQAGHGNFAAAEDMQRQMLALHPDDTDVLNSISNGLLAISGRVKEAVSMREKLRTLEPFVPVYNYITASIMLNNGQSQTAIAILKELPSADTGGFVTLARAYAAEGRFGEAADTLLTIPQTARQDRQSIEEAARLLRTAPTKVSMPDALRAWDGELGFVYVYVGAPDRVLDYPERLAAAHNLNPPALRHLWSPEFAPVRKTERFKALVRAVGFVDYWRARGWADNCHPVGADDFACE